MTIATIDSTFAASVGSCASRAIARASTDAAPAPSACRKRTKISMSMEPAPKQPMLASVNSAMPPSSTGRRPQVSDSGPYSSMPIEKPAMKLVSVRCAAPALTEKPSAIDGRLGRYMSVAIGPQAASAPSNRISRASGRRRTTWDMGIRNGSPRAAARVAVKTTERAAGGASALDCTRNFSRRRPSAGVGAGPQTRAQ